MTAQEFKAIRIASGLTQEQLAERMKASARTIRNYENGTGSLPDRAAELVRHVIGKARPAKRGPKARSAVQAATMP